MRALSPRCRGDRRFSRRTKALVRQFREDLPALLKAADELSAEPQPRHQGNKLPKREAMSDSVPSAPQSPLLFVSQ
jgi:hypothetical protein